MSKKTARKSKKRKLGRTQNPREARAWPIEWYYDKPATERNDHPRSTHE